MGDQVRVIKIDVDKNQQLASIYNVRSVPSMLLFQNGELKWRGAGVISVNELQKIIKQNTHANVD